MIPLWFRVLLAGLCVIPAVWTLGVYPLPTWPLIAALMVYAAALWRWPAAFLLVIPTVLPALDLGLWTGWMVVGEADVFILLTLAVLLVRDPPRWADLWPRGLAGLTLAVFTAVTVLGCVLGLVSPIGVTGESANPFLLPSNALRLAKGFLEALVLLPFLRQRQRACGDALSWLGAGIVLGLIAVMHEVLVERILFAGILDFSSDYRVVGPFSSMRVGGGHIGAYAALALPFALVGCVAFRRARWLLLMVPGLLDGGYTLLVTFARTAYLAGAVGGGLSGLMLLFAPARAGGRQTRLLAGIGAFVVVLGVSAAASSGYMRERFAGAAGDLLTRESNWREGWAVRDRDLVTQVAGMGLGTYQRTMRARSKINVPSDVSVREDGAGRFVSIRSDSPFYLGQKITTALNGPVHLTMRVRAEDPRAVLGYALCDKVLVYSDKCRGGEARSAHPGDWETVTATLPTDGLGGSGRLGFFHRPVELSLFDTVTGTAVAVGDVRLTDESGRSLLVNGDFRHGLDRWLFTDDSHVSWRILNQYLMILFEGGVLGLLAYLALCALALAGGWRGLTRGEPAGAAVMGAIAAFLVSGLFDNVLEAPRIATLFYLIAGAGLVLWEGLAPAQKVTRSPPLPRSMGAVEEY